MVLFQYLISAALIVAHLAFGIFDGQLGITICLALILVFGIPHGAIDHRIHFNTTHNSNFALFLVKYLSIAIGYVLFWLIQPSLALVFFLVLSSYHFGQELLEDHHINDSGIGAFITGFFIVLGPLFYHYQEANGFINVIASGVMPDLSSTAALTTAIVLLIGFICYVTIQILRKNVPLGKGSRLYLFALTIIVLNLTLSLVAAFTTYFILFHSLNAFKHQFVWLKKRRKGYNVKKFILDLVGFSLMAVFGIILLLWILSPENPNELVTYFFILTSIITLPHAVTLDQFYKSKHQMDSKELSTSS